MTNKLVLGIIFQVKPFNSGYIICDKSSPSLGKSLIPPISQYFFILPDTQCTAKPYDGFEFLSWEENLNKNSTHLIKSSHPISPLESIKDFLNINSYKSETKLKFTKFGSFTANFRKLPPPIPPEYIATLFGIVLTAFISSWLTPTIIGWRKAKKYQNKLNDYQNEIQDLYKDNKLDKNDIPNLDRLREKIISGYTKGDLTKDQYDVLLKNLSIKYNEIFNNEINPLKSTVNNRETIKLLNELHDKLDDAYLEEKIDKEHYSLLKDKIIDLKKNEDSDK